ncbi:MAG TPA: hypothetical protein DEP91_12740 [Sphingomonas bacterium]|jgi:hypothetical protein|uniref:Uncharacterized protein n=1 Tax=Sphingomonas bacterium TaxID=1895847 RepID=A0A3D0WE40_9SPHN|nr:hypothetical protein [Sphingomonas bacterium]
MVGLLFDLLLLTLSLPPDPGFQAQVARAPAPGTRTMIRIERHMVVRVPRMSLAPSLAAPASAAAPLPPISWTERKAEQCVPVAALAGASITRPDSVDLVLSGGRRMRARLGDDCPALGFYSGFYIRPPADGQICARRDSIRSRSGGECRIEGLRALIPSR